MKDKKKIVIGTLCALIMIMAVGYALLSQQLSINGSASITSNWQVEITNITEKEKSTGATTNNTNYTATTASFNTSLTSPGDYALYEVTVTNKGTLDAVLSAEPTVTTGNNTAIQYELEGIKKGDKILKNNQTDTFTIKVTYNSSTTTQPSTLTSNIEVTLNYEQDLGQVRPIYPTYSIGDKVENYKGSDWYVIKNSTEDEDYVTLMKEKVLTAEEIGNSYSYKENGTDAKPYMAYYWSSICHAPRTYGTDTYTNYDETGCAGHNDYDGSKIRSAVEGYMSAYLDASELKEVDGYKIRLITKDELIANLWYEEYTYISAGFELKDFRKKEVPYWVYSNFGEQNNIHGYWTMTPSSDYPNLVWYIASGGRLTTTTVYNVGRNSANGGDNYGVRPVINLLKSAIE